MAPPRGDGDGERCGCSMPRQTSMLWRSSDSEPRSLLEAIERHAGKELLDYEPIHAGDSAWRLLPSSIIERCAAAWLRHRLSHKARPRTGRHAQTAGVELTDSMRMYTMGIEAAIRRGQIGIRLEMGLQGDGTILRAHGRGARNTAVLAGMVAKSRKLAGAYVISPNGSPFRVV